MASAANISAFTLGSALGIWLGGQAIDAGLGLASVNWVGGSIAIAGLVLAVVSIRSLPRVVDANAHGEHGHHDPALAESEHSHGH
jgi:DHA1 family inner membrane transport protein